MVMPVPMGEPQSPRLLNPEALITAKPLVPPETARAKGSGYPLPFALFFVDGSYLASVGSPAFCSPAFLRLSQLYLRWNFSTRPVVSRNFILPVKQGGHAEQISTVMFLRVLRVVNLLPQPQVMTVSTYSG